MTDRINTFVVVLDRNIRDDDVLPLLNAVRQIRGVLTVEPHVAQRLDEMAGEHRANERWHRALREAALKATNREGV